MPVQTSCGLPEEAEGQPCGGFGLQDTSAPPQSGSRSAVAAASERCQQLARGLGNPPAILLDAESREEIVALPIDDALSRPGRFAAGVPIDPFLIKTKAAFGLKSWIVQAADGFVGRSEALDDLVSTRSRPFLVVLHTHSSDFEGSGMVRAATTIQMRLELAPKPPQEPTRCPRRRIRKATNGVPLHEAGDILDGLEIGA